MEGAFRPTLAHESGKTETSSTCSSGKLAARSWDNRPASGSTQGPAKAEDYGEGMKTIDRSRETDPGIDDIRRITALTVAVRIIFIAHQLKLREQSLTVTRNPKRPVTVDFVERTPFGFAFTAGNEAAFRVPSGHRFVIENMHVSCWAKDDLVDVQLVTRSPRMFRQVTSWPENSPIDDSLQATGAPLVVSGSTTNTFLFGNGEWHSSSTVPSDTYLQIWGYLEPFEDPVGQ
jgi:hypothetical protein